MVSWVEELRDRLHRLLVGPEVLGRHALPELSELTDEELDMLLGVAMEEGVRRGRGEGWWE
jgi:hypothetical protein